MPTKKKTTKKPAKRKKLAKASPKLVKPKRNKKGQLLPGQRSLNPDGKPAGTLSLTTLLKNELAKIPKGKGKKTKGQQLVEAVIKDALGKKYSAADRKIIFNYIEGLPKQQIEFDVSKENISELTDFFRGMGKPKKKTKKKK